MAPSKVALDSVTNSVHNNIKESFQLSQGNLGVNGVRLLSNVPENVVFHTFSSICGSSNAPLPLFKQVLSKSHKGGFLGFSTENPSDRLEISLGKFSERKFVSVFRFKTWWSTMWVGTSGSDLQMETQWVLLDVPEISSYVLILPLIEGSFRSALHPGTNGHVMICAESGSTQVKNSSFRAIAYVHICDNPYNLMKEAYSAVRVHLNTFKLLEEKSIPSLVDKFGWCTWDAFYLTVEPIGVWHGVQEFAEGGTPLRFLIIDDGWQSISIDGEQQEEANNLILGGTQMTSRLCRFEECEKFRNYNGGTMLGPNTPSFDPNRSKMLIAKAIVLEQAEKARNKEIESGATESYTLESAIAELKQQLNDEMTLGIQDSGLMSGNSKNCSSLSLEVGLKAFTQDLRTKFKGLDDIYVWHALCGALRCEAGNHPF